MIYYLSSFTYQQKSLVAKVQRREMPDMGMLFLNIKVRRSNLISDSLNEVEFSNTTSKSRELIYSANNYLFVLSDCTCR